MSDIPDRFEKEREIEASLSSVFEKYAATILDLIGDSSVSAAFTSPLSIPPVIMEAMEREIEEALAFILAGIYFDADRRMIEELELSELVEVLTSDEDEDRDVAALFDYEALLEESSIMAGTGQLMREQATTIEATQLAAAAAVAAAGLYGRSRAADLSRGLSDRLSTQVGQAANASEAFEAVQSVLGETRPSVIAATETTAANTAGEKRVKDTARKEFSATITAYWITERDSKVCPLCNELDGKPESEWPRDAGDGPPRHPNCRCYLEHE